MRNIIISVKNLTMLLAFIGLSFTITQAQVKNIVLVHGSFANGSGWEGVYKALVKKGYNVSVATNPNLGFAEDVAACKRTLDRIDGPVLLVAHSYGGAVATEAGNDPKVKGLVYVDAFVPAEGETLAQLLQSGPPNPDFAVLPPDANGYAWFDKARFHASFCADLPKDLAAFMADSQLPINASVFGASVKQAAWKSKKSWYVLGTEDKTIVPDAQRYMAKRAGATITEVKGSHCAFISKPGEVAKVIETAAAGL
ncbi:alpha/beta hydrolase [Chitinophaga horti]|uniref:Alpha/beta hydrolase n=1 Tax=Chitinophaga horti TaxID=2920382 RepID=A0ABY6IWK6_9BACT|nr:alpha/beta hydrolase [Chitinophaga horti]UYQ91763.1 alpha/beta hydrolase [Chitinophaga horti]